jgi:hypothetical protein
VVHNQQYRSLSTGPLGISFPSTIPSLAIAGHGKMGFLAIWLPLLRRRTSRSSGRMAPKCNDIAAEHGFQWYRGPSISGTSGPRASGLRRKFPHRLHPFPVVRQTTGFWDFVKSINSFSIKHLRAIENVWGCWMRRDSMEHKLLESTFVAVQVPSTCTINFQTTVLWVRAACIS